MPKFTHRSFLRRATLMSLVGGLGLTGAAVLPASASANSSQLSIIQDGSAFSNPAGAFKNFRSVGANTVRVIVEWAAIAPNAESSHKPKGFNASDPNAYPAGNWTGLDNLVRTATANHVNVDLTVSGGAPLWAEGKGVPKQGKNINFAWKPNAAAYGQFVSAIGKRYNGSFTPKTGGGKLPAVKFWAIYNEPNFGEDLGPQAVDGSRISVAPMMFRGLLNAGWKALQQYHKHQTIIWGEFAARGNTFHRPWNKAPQGLPGNYGQTKPLLFLRTLYCVGTNDRPLRGGAARAVGCPTTGAAARSFRAHNPALFNASGVSDHPYAASGSPVRDGLNDPNFAAFPALGKFGRELDRLTGTYGGHPHFAVYNTEYGYITHPPSHAPYVSPNTAAYYINWAEYLSYKNRRIKSYMQYLLTDPPANAGPYAGFASGLEKTNGAPKATFYAYRMPLYLPHTSFSHKSAVEVWGAARPAPFAALDGFGLQRARLQFKAAHAGWKTLTTFKVNHAGGYYDLHVKFAQSGQVRVQWTFPTSDNLFNASLHGFTASSRAVNIKVH
jgi:hypothetical protein